MAVPAGWTRLLFEEAALPPSSLEKGEELGALEDGVGMAESSLLRQSPGTRATTPPPRDAAPADSACSIRRTHAVSDGGAT